MKEELVIEYDNNIGLDENIQRMCESIDAYDEIEWMGQKGGFVGENEQKYVEKYKCKGYKLANNLYVYEIYINNLLEHTLISDSDSFEIIVKDWSTRDFARSLPKMPKLIDIYSEYGKKRLSITDEYEDSIVDVKLSTLNGQENTEEEFKEKLFNDSWEEEEEYRQRNRQRIGQEKEYTKKEAKEKFFEENWSQWVLDELPEIYKFYKEIIRALEEVTIEKKNNEPENEVSEEQKGVVSNSDEYIASIPVLDVKDTPMYSSNGKKVDRRIWPVEQRREYIGIDEPLDGYSTEELDRILETVNEENAKKQEIIKAYEEEAKRVEKIAKIKEAIAKGYDLDKKIAQYEKGKEDKQ